MVFRFLFGGPKRLDSIEDATSALARENRALRAKVARLEVALVQRRADDILGARDALIPVPRPGSAATRLLTQNRLLRKRAKVADERADVVIEGALVDMFAVADGLEARGHGDAAADVRARADALVAKVRAVNTVEPVAEISVELYADLVRSTWRAFDHVKAAEDWLARFAALEPISARGAPITPAEFAALAGLVVSSLLTSGPRAAADVIRQHADVTDDSFAVAAEATLYALAGALGDDWTEENRTAWALAIDAVAKALGVTNTGAAIFSSEDSLGISQV